MSSQKSELQLDSLCSPWQIQRNQVGTLYVIKTITMGQHGYCPSVICSVTSLERWIMYCKLILMNCFCTWCKEANVVMPQHSWWTCPQFGGSTHGLPGILVVLIYIKPSCLSCINGHNNYDSLVTFWQRMSCLDNHVTHNNVSTWSSPFMASNWKCPTLSVGTWCLRPHRS
jgi:hypothetical protein